MADQAEVTVTATRTDLAALAAGLVTVTRWGIGPVLIALLAGSMLGEGFPRRLFAGCAVAFAGCVMIGFATTRSGTRAGLGIALCITAALAYSIAVVVQKPVLARVSPLQVTWLGCAAASVACLPFAPALVAEAVDAPPVAIGWLAAAGGALCLVGVCLTRRD